MVSQHKKTLYEVLEVSSKASNTEIKAAYQNIIQRMQSKEYGLSGENAELKLKIVNFAFDTLSVHTSRESYDAKLNFGKMPAQQVLPIKLEVALEDKLKSPLRAILTVIAGLIAIGMVIQLAFMLLAYLNSSRLIDNSERVPSEVSKAEEKVILQEYYQEHGVRAGSKIEADLLNSENRRDEIAQRLKENEKREQERKYQQFIAESKRVGDQVSYDLRRAEQQAEYERKRKQDQQEAQLRREKQSQEMAEQRRIENEKSKWSNYVSPNRSNYGGNY